MAAIKDMGYIVTDPFHSTRATVSKSPTVPRFISSNYAAPRAIQVVDDPNEGQQVNGHFSMLNDQSMSPPNINGQLINHEVSGSGHESIGRRGRGGRKAQGCRLQTVQVDIQEAMFLDLLWKTCEGGQSRIMSSSSSNDGHKQMVISVMNRLTLLLTTDCCCQCKRDPVGSFLVWYHWDDLWRRRRKCSAPCTGEKCRERRRSDLESTSERNKRIKREEAEEGLRRACKEQGKEGNREPEEQHSSSIERREQKMGTTGALPRLIPLRSLTLPPMGSLRVIHTRLILDMEGLYKYRPPPPPLSRSFLDHDHPDAYRNLMAPDGGRHEGREERTFQGGNESTPINVPSTFSGVPVSSSVPVPSPPPCSPLSSSGPICYIAGQVYTDYYHHYPQYASRIATIGDQLFRFAGGQCSSSDGQEDVVDTTVGVQEDPRRYSCYHSHHDEVFVLQFMPRNKMTMKLLTSTTRRVDNSSIITVYNLFHQGHPGVILLLLLWEQLLNCTERINYEFNDWLRSVRTIITLNYDITWIWQQLNEWS